jgi:hypothetical protein
MYLPSNTPIMQEEQDEYVRRVGQDAADTANMRLTSALGRTRLFNTMVNPLSVVCGQGMGTGLDVAKLQAQTQDARATAILGTGGQIDTEVSGGPSIPDIIANAPEVVSLNRGGGCKTPSYAPTALWPSPQPGMPGRAPRIEQSPYGPMYFRGEDSTMQGSYPTRTGVEARRGLTGYAPPWSDAGVLPNGGSQGFPDTGVGQWISDHPWFALALAGAGALVLSRRKR